MLEKLRENAEAGQHVTPGRVTRRNSPRGENITPVKTGGMSSQ